MGSLGRIADVLGANSAFVVPVLAAAVLLLLVATAYLLVRVRKLSRRWPTELSAGHAEELARTLGACAAGIKDVQERLGVLSSKLDQISAQQLLCVQKLGFVRFDAFDDVGGEQSFSLALLDANNCGVVMSSIYSRSDSRLYAKRVSAGNASHVLSREEEEAIRQASESRVEN